MKIDVNGITLNYEKVGTGSPLIMVHGNGETHEIFNVAREKLKDRYTCYLIDSRGHGESSPVETYSYQPMRQDIIEFIKALDLKNVTFYGFSDGGIIGLLVASQTDLIDTLIISGANTRPDAVSKKLLWMFRIMWFFGRDEKIHMMLKEPNIDDSELFKIKAKTLVLAGSNDIIQESHTRHIADCIKGSTLCILPGEDHGSYIKNSEKIADIILNFCK